MPSYMQSRGRTLTADERTRYFAEMREFVRWWRETRGGRRVPDDHRVAMMSHSYHLATVRPVWESAT